MRNSKQKFNSLLDRHPWALQFALALGIVLIALAATFYQGISGEAQAAAGPTVIDTPAANAQWHIGETQSVHWTLGNEIMWIGMGADAKVGYAVLQITDGSGVQVGIRQLDITMADVANPDGMGIDDYVVGSSSFPSGYSSDRSYRFRLFVYEIAQPNRQYEVYSSPFHILPAATVPISATYYSKTFSVAPYNVAPEALDYLKADFSPVLVGSGFNIDFAISFLNASDQPVWTATDYPDSFDTDGYLMVTTDREEELGSPDGYLLGWLQGNPAKFNQIRSVRFRIYMATMDVTAGGPWVQSVTLQYKQASTADIGVINFVDTPGADGTVTKTIAHGTTGSFDIKVTPLNGFSGQVVLSVGPITKVGSGEDVSGKIIASNMPQTLTIPSGATDVPATVQFTVNDDETLSGLYRFTISGHDTSNENATLVPADWGRINVPESTGLFGLAITPATQTVVKGQSTTYTITLTRSSGFTGTVTLGDNIATIFGAGVTASYSDGSLSGADTGSILTVATTTSATPTDAKTFTVTGQATDQPDQIATAQLSIVTSDQAITLSLTIPVEPAASGKSADNTLPSFTLRLYNGLTKTYEKTNFTTNAQNQASVTATRTEIPNGTYTVYARSNRHLWGKSTQTNLVIDATASYTLTFPTLKAGNLDTNNRINSLDLPPWMNDYGKTIAGLLGDLNNDGKVNVLDVAFIFGLDHYGAWGDQLPDETR